MAKPKEVWLLILEAESGAFCDGTTYAVLGAYTTEALADAAREDWRAEHKGTDHDGEVHELGEDGWCSCGEGVTVDGPITVDGEEV